MRTSIGCAPCKTLARNLLHAFIVLFIVLCSLEPSSAFAQTVPRLEGQITDLTSRQVLAGDRQRIDTSLAQLLQRQNIQLWVLFVESTGRLSVTQYADEVARQNSLGSNDALLVVALSDRTDALWRGSAMLSKLSDRQLENVLSQQVEPALAKGDYAGAVVGAADGLATAAGTSDGQPSGSGGLSLGWIVVVILLAIGAFWAWNSFSAHRRQRREAAERERQTEQLAQEANALLIAADEGVRDAKQEIEFAELQFGKAEVVPYREAVGRAAEELKAAFAVRQKLDDDVPEDPETRRRMVEQIVEHARRSQALLDEQEKRIEALRDLERRAPELLATLPAQIDALEGRIPEAESTMASLRRYAESSITPVEGNIERTRTLVAEARDDVSEGRRALGSGDRSAAGPRAREAQQAWAEANQLLDAVDNLATSLRKAEEAVGPQLATAAKDIGTARDALAGQGMADQDRRLQEAERALDQAQREMAADRPDVLAALRLGTQAEAIADQALAQARQEEERREREQQMLAVQLQAAESSYNRAADFIAARRHYVGETARTRLAEAERHFQRARSLAPSDPRAAIEEARRAQQLADEAYSSAQSDFDARNPFGGAGGHGPGPVIPIPFPFPFPMGGGFGGRRRGTWGGGFRGSGRSVGGGWGGGSRGGGGSVGGRW